MQTGLSADVPASVSTDAGKASGFGTVFLVFPKNGASIAVAPYADIWQLNVQLYKEMKVKMANVNKHLKDYHLDPDDLTAQNMLDKLGDKGDFSRSKFEDPEKSFSYENLDCKLKTIRNLSAGTLNNREVWFEGPCMMIEVSKSNQVHAALKAKGLV